MKRIHNNIVLVNKGDFESEDYQNKIAEFQYVFAEREDGKIRLCKARHNLTHAGDFLANVKDKEPAKAGFSPSVCSVLSIWLINYVKKIGIKRAIHNIRNDIYEDVKISINFFNSLRQFYLSHPLRIEQILQLADHCSHQPSDSDIRLLNKSLLEVQGDNQVSSH